MDHALFIRSTPEKYYFKYDNKQQPKNVQPTTVRNTRSPPGTQNPMKIGEPWEAC